jgi:hypothetical protein
MAGSESSSQSITFIGAVISDSWMVAFRLVSFVMRFTLNLIPDNQRPEMPRALLKLLKFGTRHTTVARDGLPSEQIPDTS